MAEQQLICAGFGGQGILSMGKFLAYAGMDSNKNVSWLPSYGPEMRGGTANCSVVISDELVGSPVVTELDAVIVMNRPSLDKFEEMLHSGGLVILDSDIVDRMPERDDVEVIAIPAQTEAEKLGSKKIANMILLGAYVQKTGIVSLEATIQALADHGKAKFLELNKNALEVGASYAK
ncbi:2-oxoacid:acceptor oxidoreductase family protein [Clostridium sp. DL1XJH146]